MFIAHIVACFWVFIAEIEISINPEGRTWLTTVENSSTLTNNNNNENVYN